MRAVTTSPHATHNYKICLAVKLEGGCARPRLSVEHRRTPWPAHSKSNPSASPHRRIAVGHHTLGTRALGGQLRSPRPLHLPDNPSGGPGSRSGGPVGGATHRKSSGGAARDEEGRDAVCRGQEATRMSRKATPRGRAEQRLHVAEERLRGKAMPRGRAGATRGREATRQGGATWQRKGSGGAPQLRQCLIAEQLASSTQHAVAARLVGSLHSVGSSLHSVDSLAGSWRNVSSSGSREAPRVGSGCVR